MKQSLLFFLLTAAMLIVGFISFNNLQAGEAKHSEPTHGYMDAHEHSPFREKCYTCHGNEAAYAEWKTAGHAKALINLDHGDHPARVSCLSCHSAGYEIHSRIGRSKDHPYNLKNAVNAVSCSSCHLHSSTREHLLVKSPRKLCVSCHKMDCGCAGEGIIHKSQTEMFLGRDGKGVRRKPSPHVRAMKKRCIHCHMAKKESKDEVAKRGGHTFIADFSICADCHDDMEARLKRYREEIGGKMKAVKAMLDHATDPHSEAFKAAKWNYDMVKGDSGYGLHNIPYARMLLDYSLSLKSTLLEPKDGKEPDAGGE